MTSKHEKDRTKQIQDRCQNILIQMLKDEDNKYCVDCDAKGPRWASWNLGIFLCIRCAGIHRNLGVHISKVKSVNLDSWTPEQVVSLQQMGNSRARAVYEANLPDAFRRPQNDTSLETFIRAKYEQKKYIAKEWVQPPLPKVNWDKEIDEEIERQKRKKKATSSTLGPLPLPANDKKYNKSDVIPSLPKPKSSVSPKSHRTPTTSISEPGKATNGTTDLLGLNIKQESKTSEDIFSTFFSAPQAVEAKKEKTDLKTEEENFFNQPAPTEKEKSQLTKDSILALYSQSPAVNMINQFNTSQPYTYQSYQSNYAIPAQNGAQFNNFPANNQVQQPFNTQMPQFQGQMFAHSNQQALSNQGLTQPLAQQFGSMNIGQSYPNVLAQQNANSNSNITWQ